jgi:hypothetical protein
MREPLLAGLLLSILICAACRKEADRTPSIGVAYAGPAVLNLRKGILPQSPVVATVKHGARLEIIQHRRRSMRVRTENGMEGWTEEHLLLSAADMTALHEIEQRARSLPSQGVASTYGEVNVHTEPYKQAPSFFQIKEGEKVDVVAHSVVPRIEPPRSPLILPKPKEARARKRPDGKYPLPAMPSPPAPPRNWLELSKTPPDVLARIAEEKAENAPPNDDWSLVRNRTGESGWVYTRMLYMAIPDEVAQYAEGHRITSYFPLAEVDDEGQKKHVWVWTTIAGPHPYDFDSFRVFTWNLRRHRYETAFIERKVAGYFPVLVHTAPAAATANSRTTASGPAYPGFSVCLQNDDGTRSRRNYVFIVNVVRFAGETPCEAPANLLVSGAGGQANPTPGNAPAAKTSLSGWLKNSVGALAKKWFNR